MSADQGVSKFIAVPRAAGEFVKMRAVAAGISNRCSMLFAYSSTIYQVQSTCIVECRALEKLIAPRFLFGEDVREYQGIHQNLFAW